MQLGRVFIPDVSFPPDIAQRLETYLRVTGDELSYVANMGIDDEAAAGKDDRERGLLRLFAAIEYLRGSPEEGIVALNVAAAFEALGDIDHAVAVLKSIDEAGGLGCYRYPGEDPAFLAGWILADADRPSEAVPFYQRALESLDEASLPVALAHLGAIHHHLGHFESAVSYYRRALEGFDRPYEVKAQAEEKLVASWKESHAQRARANRAVIADLIDDATSTRKPAKQLSLDSDGLQIAP